MMQITTSRVNIHNSSAKTSSVFGLQIAVPFLTSLINQQQGTQMSHFSQKADSQIQQDVLNENKWDPRVTGSKFSVKVKDGIITLRGSVPHDFKKSSAGSATQRLSGVRAVADEIEVNIMGSYERSDDLKISQSNFKKADHND